MTARYPIGTLVSFTWHDGRSREGTVVDAITFNGKTRYGVEASDDGRTYDVWPNTSIVREA